MNSFLNNALSGEVSLSFFLTYLTFAVPRFAVANFIKLLARIRYTIAKSAAKQSGRGIIPFVGPVLSFKEALELSRELDVVLIPYELAEDIQETKNVISQISRGQSVGIFIGPEGGFDKEEIELAVLAGAKPITLEKRILRTETAGVTAMSILMFHLEQ